MEKYEFHKGHYSIRLFVEWFTKHKNTKDNADMVDLDLKILVYDNKARLVERLDGDCKVSRDGSIELVSDIGASEVSESYLELAKSHLDKVDPTLEAIVLFLDGGIRNYSMTESLQLTCRHTPNDRGNVDTTNASSSSSSSSSSVVSGSSSSGTLVTYKHTLLNPCEGIVVAILYKVYENKLKRVNPKWVLHPVYEPVMNNSMKSKYDLSTHLITTLVPTLERYKPRLFSSVRDLCAALTSQALPNLKKIFLKYSEGLDVDQFMRAIFLQLSTTHPQVLEEEEGASTIALIQEMFSQIDYNNDRHTDWDEFTTFCIQMGVVSNHNTGAGKTQKSGNINTMGIDDDDDEEDDGNDEYDIFYSEDVSHRDQLKFPHRNVLAFHYLPETKKIILVAEGADHVYILNDQFKYVSKFSPLNVQMSDMTMSGQEIYMMPADKKIKFQIYDAVKLGKRELYAFCVSDHTIIICKETITLGGANIRYTNHNRILHNILHKKLCWSEASQLLCSLGADQSIYGWDIDLSYPIYQISRHTDVVTDIIAVDHMNMLITCSMDKRIMIWSAHTRRVKGVLQEHTRGVRCLSNYKHILLSAGFESEARTWDLRTLEPQAILRGHKHPLVTCTLMCDKAHTERDYRAITVDDTGELRLWNIYIPDGLGNVTYLSSIQVFTMNCPESPMTDIRYIACPYHPKNSVKIYSDIIACSTKVMHFIPEFSMQEYIPPTCSCYNGVTAVLSTAAGKYIHQYDICTGEILETITTDQVSEITCMNLDVVVGRRLYVGFSNGELQLLNFMTGTCIDRLMVHTKELTSIVLNQTETTSFIYTSSVDGKICMIDEVAGQLILHNTIEYPFGYNVVISGLKYVPVMNVLMGYTVTTGKWAIWNASSMKRLVYHEEKNTVIGLDTIVVIPIHFVIEGSETVLTQYHMVSVVALNESLVFYYVDISRGLCVPIKSLSHYKESPLTSIVTLKSNHSSITAGGGAAATTTTTSTQLNDKSITATTIQGTARASASPPKTRQTLKSVESLSLTTNKGIDSPPISETVLSGHATYIICGYEDGSIQTWKVVDYIPILQQQVMTYINTVKIGMSSMLKLSPKIVSKSMTFSSLDTTSSDVWNMGEYDLNKDMMLYQDQHCDQICTLVTLDDHHCVVTVSLDGYKRVLQVTNGEVLGEIPLPNVTDEMKYNHKQKLGHHGGTTTKLWSFVLDTIPVKSTHIQLAKQLIKEFKSKSLKTNTTMHKNESQKRTSIKSKLSTSLSNEGGKDIQSILRNTVLSSLKDPTANDETTISPPPTAPNTQRLHYDTEDDVASTRSPSIKSSISSITNLDQLTSRRHGSSKHAHSVTKLKKSSSNNRTLAPNKKLKPIKLWSTIQDICTQSSNALGGQLPRAFSEMSLKSNQQAGGISVEEYRILRAIGKDDSKVTTYTSSQPQLLLKDPMQSIHVNIPRLNAISQAEIAFGPQAELFKNAEKYMKEKDTRVNRHTQLQTIALSRIEQDIRSAGSMIRVIPAKTMDDVTNMRETSVHKAKKSSKDEYDTNITLNEEDQMKLRLQKSAKLVPSTHTVYPGQTTIPSLDRERLEEIVGRVNQYIETKPIDKLHMYNADTTIKHTAMTTKREVLILRDQLEKQLGQAIVGLFKFKLGITNTTNTTNVTVNSSRGSKRTATASSNSSSGSPTHAATATSATSASSFIMNDPPIALDESMASELGDSLDFSSSNVKAMTSPTPSSHTNPMKDSRVYYNTLQKQQQLHSAATTQQSMTTTATATGKNTTTTTAITGNTTHITVQVNQEQQQQQGDEPVRPSTAMVNEKVKAHRTQLNKLLFPFYSVQDIDNFMDMFLKIDDNFSSDLDIHEWILFFSVVHRNVSELEARKIFYKIDRDNDGLVQLHEFLPIIFNRATKKQIALILKECLLHYQTVNHHVPLMKLSDIYRLFECYDMDKVGYIKMEFFRDRIRAMEMSERVTYDFLENIASIKDEDMISRHEFIQLLKSYIVK